MALTLRKGFVYSLEAVIASSILISMILFVIPEITGGSEINLEPVETSLQSLDSQGNLGNTTGEINNSLEPDKPGRFNLTTIIVSRNLTQESVSGEEEFQLENGSKKLLLWVDEAQDLEITYRDETIVSNDFTGYKELDLATESGHLNFTGTSIQLDFEVSNFQSEGEVPEADTVYSVNYIDFKDGLREVRVMIWR